MIDLIKAYQWTLFGGVFGGAALSLVGAQLASRNQAVQTLVVSQAASLGVVIGLAITILTGGTHDHPHEGITLTPLISGFATAGLFYLLCEVLISHRWVSRNTYYVGLFGLLMSLTYTIMSLVPSLESHTAASYFGDLTVASDSESVFVGIAGILTRLFFLYRWREITSWSFESVTFGAFSSSRREVFTQRIFLILTLVLIAASVQFLGLLFTVSCLFIPVMVLARMQKSFQGLAAKLAISSFFGVFLGVMASLVQGSLPTVPTVALSLLLTSLVVGAMRA